MHEMRNRIAATSNVPIAARAQRWNRSKVTGKPTASIARKARKRGGAIMLPMVCGFAMAGSVTKARYASSERIFMPWLWLIVGGLFEVGFTTSLRFVDGFRNLQWTIAFLISVAISMALLEFASSTIPMGTA